MTSKKQNAQRKKPGANVSKVRASETNFETKVCNQNHIRRLRNELAKAGLLLKSTKTECQSEQLLKTLQYLGSRGLSTFEGTAAGYVRLATRVKELTAHWCIAAPRENVIGPDGLFHPRMARYTLIGRRADFVAPQAQLDFGADHGA